MTTDNFRENSDAVRDAIKLLQGLEFSTEEGIVVGGEHVRVVITPRWNGFDAFRLMLTCYAFGDRKVEWAGLPVRLTVADNSRSPVFIFRVNPRGQAIIDNVPGGEYKVSVMATYFGGSEEPVFVPASNLEQLAAAGEELEQSWPEPMMTCTSNDARLIAVPEIDTSGNAMITFESRNDIRMDGTVRFALIDSSGKVVFADELVLERDDTHGIWTAHWEGQPGLNMPVNLVFDFLPALSGNDN